MTSRERTELKVTFWGTRGSLPVCHPDMIKTGGNTTCARVHSNCLPEGVALVIDAGSGFYPMAKQLLDEGIKRVVVVFTHWHLDHILGWHFAPFTYYDSIQTVAYGLVEDRRGPKEALEHLMMVPYHPVSAGNVLHRFRFHPLRDKDQWALVFHPQGGRKLMQIHQLHKLGGDTTAQVAFPKGRFPLGECLVITMSRTRHPEHTMAYRFDDHRAGKVLVFCTDHENTDGVPVTLRPLLSGADLLVMDAQYSTAVYPKKVGFGHGSP